MPSRWVHFTYENATDTNLAVFEKKQIKDKPRYKYLLIQIGDRWAVASVPLNHSGRELTAFIERPIVASEEHVAEVRSRYPDRQFVPFQIDASTDHVQNCAIILGLIVLLLILPGLALVISGIRQRRRLAAFEAAAEDYRNR
jgi:hypothetical protein